MIATHVPRTRLPAVRRRCGPTSAAAFARRLRDVLRGDEVRTSSWRVAGIHLVLPILPHPVEVYVPRLADPAGAREELRRVGGKRRVARADLRALARLVRALHGAPAFHAAPRECRRRSASRRAQERVR